MTMAHTWGGEPVAVLRAGLLVLGLIGLYALYRMRPDKLAHAGASLLAAMWVTTVIPASVFDICRPGWTLFPSRTVTAVRRNGTWGTVQPTRPVLAPKAPERR